MLGYYALLHVVIGWFGRGRVRDPPALGVGRRVRGRRGQRCSGCDSSTAAWRRVSGLLTAVSLPLVFWGQNARGYAAMVALVAGSFAALLRARSSCRSRWAWIAYVVLTTLAVYASFVAVFAVPAQVVALAWWRRDRWRRVGSAMVACALCWIPLAVLARSTRGSGQLFWIPRPSLKTEGR